MVPYGVFVWGAWAVTALGLMLVVARTLWRAQKWAQKDRARTPEGRDPE